MAASRAGVCLQRFGINLNITNQVRTSVPYKICYRYLRGTRYRICIYHQKITEYFFIQILRENARKEPTKQELRFRQLLKDLKLLPKSSNLPQEKETHDQAVISEGNIVFNASQNSENEEKYSDVTKGESVTYLNFANQFQILEEKITPLKNLPYTRQLERKYKKCLSCLRLLGEKLHSVKVPITLGPDKLPCPVELVLPSPVIDSYRNKDEFSIGPGLDGTEKTVGFYVNSGVDNPSKYCINPDEISIIKDSHKALIKDFQNYIRQSSLPASIKHDDGGYWRNISVRSNEKNDLMAVIVMNPQALTKEELQIEKEKLKDYFSAITKSYNLRSLYFQACPLSFCSHEQAPFELLLGEPCIIEELNGLKLCISPESYFLTNTKIVESVNHTLLKLCKVKTSTTVIDVCCGTGPLSLAFSHKVKRCIGIDASAQAINDANVNAEANNKGNVDFIQGHVEHLLKMLLDDAFHEDLLVVINPSKINLSKAIVKSLRECKHLKKVIYISTKPQNSLEDFVQLCKPCGSHAHLGKPFYPILAVPVDFFPQTEHFGLILMLQRL